MKISNKPNILAGAILLLMAAFFSISLALLPLDFGNFGPAQNNLLYIVAFTLGDMLFSVYGFSSVLIPVFLLVAGLSCFASKWTSKKSMRLLTAVVPFFTSVFIEKLCRYFAKDYTDDFSTIKIILAIIIGVMLVVMEIIIAGLVAERINDMIFHREKFLAEKEQKLAEKHKIVFGESEKSDAEETENSGEIFKSRPENIFQKENAESPVQENQNSGLETESVEQPQNSAKNVGAKNENERSGSGEARGASEPTEVAEPVVQHDDPFANLFDEDETQNANSMITQEEFAALNGISAEEEPDENEIFDSAEPADDLEWPDSEEIKAQAGAVEIPVEVEDDDSVAERASSDEKSAEKSDEMDEENDEESEDLRSRVDSDEPRLSENVENGSDFDELEDSLNDFEKYNDEINSEDDFDYEDSENQAAGPENSKETLSPDFFDIDMNSEESIEDENDDENHYDEPASEKTENIEEETPAESADDENSTISFDSDVFADMENDARKQLEGGENDSFFDDEKNAENGFQDEPFEQDEISDENSGNPENFESSENEFENHSETEFHPETEDGGESRTENGSVSSSEIEIPGASENPAEPTVEGRVIETAPVPERKTIATEAAPLSHVARPKKPYVVPTDLLEQYEDDQYWLIDNETKESAVKLKKTFSDFGISAEVIGIKKGPVVTMFEIAPAPGVKLSKIVALQDNIALSLAASSVRIVAPIPGKAAVGIEVPNKKRSIVSFREMIEQDLPEFQKMAIPVILGKDILGKSQIIDIAKTPHLLIAGATGAGKSVCVNSIILSILYKRSPQQVKMILVDPKVVELKLYNDIPHLLTPVITEPKKALQGLQWCLCEMERRYALLDQMGVRDISSYNKRVEERKIATEKLPYIVIIIDEFADLMATSGKELESNVARLAAMSRAVGIHLVLATQRPSVNVITGLIKANIPSRIAFMVASRTDSNIIIDAVGAEKLLGKGDMLYASAVSPYPVRIQGTFESDSDVEHVVDYVKTLGEPDYIDDEIFVDDDDDDDGQQNFYGDEADPLYEQALDIVIQSGKASASYIQRRLKVGYNRAARLVEEMEARGIVGPANGSKPREIIHVPS